MRYLILVVIGSLLCSINLSAQSYIKSSFGASLTGSYAGSIESGMSNQTTNGEQTYARYIDSMASFKSPKLAFGINFWGHLMLGKRMTIQAGLGYQDVGFEVLQDNLQYNQPTYPGIGLGKILDNSAGSGTKSITYNYHFRYLQIPILFHYEIYHTRDFYYRISATGGIAFSYLMGHSITATLKNFSVDNKEEFTLYNSIYSARRLSFNMMLGAKGEYRLDKKTVLYVIPLVGFYPVSVSNSPINSYPWYVQLQLGVQYAFKLQEEKKK